jgi:hypothetical protein
MTSYVASRRQATLRFALLTGTALGAVVLGVADPSIAKADQQFLNHDSLVVSSTTYDNTQGAISKLMIGSPLATGTAIANNDYVNVWNNASVDGNFGVTTAIQLTDINLSNNRVFRTMTVPTDQVVTSFSSKSELGLHVANDWPRTRVIFGGYAGPGLGALDASNSDAVPGQDPTNPVTIGFGSNYAFSRTIVSVDEKGQVLYTPTIDYGGDNGRSAVMGSNGLYYMVGNSNNGDASTFGPSNGTNPDVTETTGLNAITPIDSLFANASIPAGNSAEVDPTLQFALNKGKLDKAGKDTNFRGVTEFGGALYFTKGSGSNGINTVYTVIDSSTGKPFLPTVANAGAATTKISVVPGFPTDSARDTGGDYAPFAIFFANPTTMYVSDDGTTGSAADVANAGLEKWSLDTGTGTWHLDYVLTKGLIGAVDSGLNGSDGPWPDISTIGLRNMTGKVNGNGTVTIWAVTSTKSTSGDNGADPNKVVQITDQIAATSLTGSVAQETFTTLLGPVYGTVFRGVGYVD